MEDYLYRYISFETLVGMVQSKELTFVLPEVWDDPKENFAFVKFIENMDDIYKKMMFIAAYFKTYAQCWTTLSESDAMWRIYSYNNRSIRIKISHSSAEKLANVRISPVQYDDTFDNNFDQDENAFFNALSQKRKAFAHEKEIRLISHYIFSSDDDFERHIKAQLVICNHPQSMEILENLFPNMSVEEQIDRVVEILNIGNKREVTKAVSFSHIPNFIESVMVHPLAPEWYVKIVSDYCDLNNVYFEGKSDLYKVDE